MKVAVLGAGKMGLPLACVLASRGADVTACDPNEELISAINAAEAPFDEPGLGELLASTVHAGRLRGTTDNREGIAGTDVAIVIVPVKLSPDRTADLSIIESIADDLAAALPRGALAVFETTLPVGTSRRLGSRIEGKSGMKAGSDFFLAFSPERVKSRLVLRHLCEHPKIIGGHDPESSARCVAFYERFLGAPVIDVGTLEAAELAKLAGMAYRDVNIALANELARYSERMGIDFEPVRISANTDGESMILVPGIGVGGHCTPVYPYFLLQGTRERGSLELVERGRKINETQPAAVLDRLGPLSGRRITILGVAFRPEVKEASYSPAFALRDEIARRGGRCAAVDPLFTDDELRALGFEPGATEDGAYALVLQTGHQAFREIDLKAVARAGTEVVVDGRRFWSRDTVESVGMTYVGVGVPAKQDDRDRPVSR